MRRGAALGLLASSCVAGQTHPNLFSTDWEDDQGRSIAAVYQKIGSLRAVVGADVAVGVAGESDKLVGVPLAGGSVWSFAHPIDVRPMVVGTVVVAQGNGELFCLDALTGKRRWTRPVGPFSMRGAGDDGKVTVVTLAGPQGALFLAVDRDGSVLRQVDAPNTVGVPAVLAGYAFVPWSNQYVSVLDLTSGDEAGRVVVRGKVTHAFTANGGLFFGEQELFRFDDKIKDASRNQATKLTLPQRELPGIPSLMASGEDKVSPVALAFDKTRVYLRPAATGAALEAQRFYGTYFRLVMAFDAQSTRLAWVHSHPVDVVGAAAGSSTFVLCDETGKVQVLDATTGGLERELALGVPLKSCVVQDDGLAGTTPQPPLPLADQIRAALTNRDAEMVSGQRLLLREMATLGDDSVTKTLIDLASNPLTAPLLLEGARASLAARRTGARYMIEALQQHYDFLRDVLRPPPVGPMAQALAAMKERAAAPLLAAHLLDPADTDDDVRQAAAALVDLADPSEAAPLTQFLALYRASPDSDAIQAAVISAGQALLVHGGAEGRRTVDAALKDALTAGGVRARLAAIEQQLDAQKASQ